MPKRGTKEQIKLLKQREEYESHKAKRAFFIILDIITLSAFILALYYTYFEDYTKVILFLVIGTVILMYFIVRGILRKKKR
jgi:L-asparagine transporter-like permease